MQRDRRPHCCHLLPGDAAGDRSTWKKEGPSAPPDGPSMPSSLLCSWLFPHDPLAGKMDQWGQAGDTQPSLCSTWPLTVGNQAGNTKEAIKIKTQPSCLPLPPAPELWAPAVCLRWEMEGTSPGIAGCTDTPVQGNCCGQAHTGSRPACTYSQRLFPSSLKGSDFPELGQKSPWSKFPAPSGGVQQCLGG